MQGIKIPTCPLDCTGAGVHGIKGWCDMNYLWLLLAHYILDYPLQGDFLAQTKGKYFYSLFAHSMIYGLGMALVLHWLGADCIALKALLLVSSHMYIDYIKATAREKSKALAAYLYTDQALHIVINFVLYAI
jgi:hypothetical protein